MIGKIASMGLQHGLTIETMLDPKIQPFLYDHQIGGTPVLPGVMGIEAFAEAALWMLPGWHVKAIEEVDFLAPFKFYRNEPRTLTIQSVFYPQGDALTADCRLIGSRPLPNQAEPQVTTHFTARVRLTKQPQILGVAAPPPDVPAGSIMEAADIYRVYFHGPAYQVLERAWRDGDRIIGLMAKNLPDNHHPAERPAVASPRLIELCFQTAGLWEMSEQGRMGLPQHVHQVCFGPLRWWRGRPAGTGRGCPAMISEVDCMRWSPPIQIVEALTRKLLIRQGDGMYVLRATAPYRFPAASIWSRSKQCRPQREGLYVLRISTCSDR